MLLLLNPRFCQLHVTYGFKPHVTCTVCILSILRKSPVAISNGCVAFLILGVYTHPLPLTTPPLSVAPSHYSLGKLHLFDSNQACSVHVLQNET